MRDIEKVSVLFVYIDRIMVFVLFFLLLNFNEKERLFMKKIYMKVKIN